MDLIQNLEYDTLAAIIKQLHEIKEENKKFHCLVPGNINEHLFAKVGDELIWESREEKLWDVTIKI